MWRRFRLFLAGSMIIGLLGATPTAAQDDFSEPTDGAGELFQGEGGGESPGPNFTYPPEWDPAQNPDVLAAGYLFPGAVINLESGAMFDPFVNEIILTDGTVTDLDGNVIFVDPFLAPPSPGEYNTLVAGGIAPAWGPLDGTPEGLERFLAGPEEPTPPIPADASQNDALATAEPSSDAPHPMEAEDDILEHYRLGTPLDELSGFAIDDTDLPQGALPEALQFTTYEIALLFQLGAFDNSSPWAATFENISEQFDLDGISRDDLINILKAVDSQFATRSSLYGQSMTIEDRNVMWGVQPIPNGMYGQLARGEFGFIVGHEYAAGFLRLMATGADSGVVATSATDIQLETALVRAVEALEIQEDLNRLQQLELDDLRNQVAQLANPRINELTTPVSDDVAVPAPDAGDDGDLVLYSAIAGLAGVLLLGALFFFISQRRGSKGAPDPVQFDSDAAMATNQLLAGARDEDDIVRILDRAAETQVGHPTMLFHAVSDGLQPVGSQSILTGSDLNRVVTSGQRATTVLRNDPAFPGETRAVIALPVIHGGKVQAVLTTHRPGDTPFTSADLLRLEPIAPALGGALERSAELGTLTRLAMVDGLTSLGNRRRLDGDLEVTIANAVAGDAPLGFAMVDVDHFKTFNDTHGHTAGDEVLRKVAATIARCVRDSDVVYRYGGEEFSMLLPGASPEEAAHVAERVREAVELEVFPGEERQPGGKLTISVGVATLASGSADDIRERADQALYQAKENGRNQVAFR